MGGFAEGMNGAALDIHERYAGHHLVNGVSVRGKHAERIRFILWFAEDFILVHDGIRGDNQAFAEFLGANFPIAGFGKEGIPHLPGKSRPEDVRRCEWAGVRWRPRAAEGYLAFSEIERPE